VGEVGRRVTLVLVNCGGVVLGALPEYTVALPYWQEVSDVVAVAQQRFGVGVSVLRLLTAERAEPPGGAVTYLAELDGGPATEIRPIAGLRPPTPDEARLADQDEVLRLPYARPGGPDASVAWAIGHLPAGAVATQQRTWNLSAIWRLADPGGSAWLKQVPPFFAHEASVVGWVADAVPGGVPEVIATDPVGRRLLLRNVDGEDLYDSPVEVRARILALSHRIHLRSMDAVEDLVSAGVPDRRGQRLTSWASGTLEDHVRGHPASSLLLALPELIDAIEACGFPDVLVHGDLHPGNAIGSPSEPTLIDWGDSFVGHPGFDALRLTVGLDANDSVAMLASWASTWRSVAPGSDPERALPLLRVVECLRLAAVYADFVARIEPSESRYHAADVPTWLDRAVEAAADGGLVPGRR
jgi:Phosphotransferase enzyme family